MAAAFPFSQPRAWRSVPPGRAFGWLLAAAGLALAVAGAARLVAQVEGDRGIAPIASSPDIVVGGIEVNVTADTGEEARLAGWKLAQRKAWEKLGGPAMGDGQIDSMVAAVVVEREQIGPRRYIARLGVIFDRTRAGQYLGTVDGSTLSARRSAPLLVIPVLYSGGAAQVFEVRGPWQKAWAQFQTGASPIDYVRPSGAGGESLILTAGQPSRRSRLWWRNVLDQFGAADVVIPVARLERQWPGGPVTGTFTARYGPDNTFLESFVLTAKDEAGVPAMLNQALVKIDTIYQRALADGRLRPDPTLMADRRAFDAAMAAIRAKISAEVGEQQQQAAAEGDAATPGATPSQPVAVVATYTVQFASPDARAVDAALAAVRGVPGVQGASTTSIAIGGTSVMRVTSSADLEALAAALRARGWQVSVGSGALRIRR